MAPTQDETRSPIRLTPASFHILLTIAKEPSHGYAIMQAVQERTKGRVKLGPGSLYWAIKRLVEASLIVEVDSKDDGRRRSYALSALGRSVLKQEVEVLADIVGYAESQELIRREKPV